MSSAIIPTSEASPKSLFDTHLVIARDNPVKSGKTTISPKGEQPATDTHKGTWQPQPGGYTPTRPGWHTLRGKSKDTLS